MSTHPDVDTFLAQAAAWRDEMASLRAIALDGGLDETLKWRLPCYTVQGGSVAIIQPFKRRCGFMFFKGALLEDPDQLLEPPGPNSRAGRRLLFASVSEITGATPALRRFIAQAIDIERSGAEVPKADDREPIPVELEAMFRAVDGLQAAFGRLTPGRQRGYLLHFSGAKRSQTRTARIERCIPKILAGKGLHD